MKVIRFTTEEGQNIWEKAMENGSSIFSGALHVTNEIFNPMTMFVSEEKFMLWIKANSLELVEKHINAVLKQVEKGILVPYRVFSETPFYEGQPQDVHQGTGLDMNRYSDTRLGTPKQALENHRQFIELALVQEPAVVTAKEPAESV